MSWENLTDTLIRMSYKKSMHQKYSENIAMFDLDGTIVKTLSGNVHPKNSSDWQWFAKGDEDTNPIISKFQKLVEDDYTIIIITNQAGMKNHPHILERIESIYHDLADQCDFSYIEIYVPIGNDIYRKPNTTIFEKYIWPKIDNIDHIFYVGDAAGRENDFADSDRKFAFNIHQFLQYQQKNKYPHVKFFTPDEYFNCESCESRTWQGLNPLEYYQNASKSDKGEINQLLAAVDKVDNLMVLIMIGPPASGKSRISDIIMESTKIPITYINQDTCKTKGRCQTLFTNGLKKKNPHLIIVDNTNPGREIREWYVNEARNTKSSKKINIKYILMDESRELYEHLNVYRERIYFHEYEEISSKYIPSIAYNKYYKSYEEVEEDSGVDEILHFKFIPKFHSRYEILMFLQRS